MFIPSIRANYLITGDKDLHAVEPERVSLREPVESPLRHHFRNQPFFTRTASGDSNSLFLTRM